jgi:hypothetical protein
MRTSGAPRLIVQSTIGVKQWLESPPSVEAVRPAACPGCGRASRPAGGRLQVHGHGLRDRQQRGPTGAGEPPSLVVLRVRRYLCRCGASVTVVPTETRQRRLYSAPAIGWALGLYGLARMTARAVRAETSPWRVVGATAAAGWTTLRRWVQAVRRGALFACVRPCPLGFSARQVAERVATTVAAYALPTVPSESPWHRVFAGAARAR